MKVSQGPLLTLFDAPDGREPLQDRLFNRLRAAILEGALKPGDRLPSTRTMAEDLGVSRNTVVAAIERLTAEGYLEARVGSGTYVAQVLPEELMSPVVRLPNTAGGGGAARRPGVPEGALPFRPLEPAADLFDMDCWSRLLAKRWRTAGALCAERDAGGGWLPLRRLLAAQLMTARGIRCQPDQVLVMPGRGAALTLVAALFGAGERVWVEDPGCPRRRAILDAGGLVPVPVPLDGDGLDPERGRQSAPDAALAIVTPNWQYPAGGTMPLRRRLALIAWAQRNGRFILEDETDGGLRFADRPLPALAGLDEGGCVLHLGGLDTTLLPALRLSWLVVPSSLVARAVRMRDLLGLGCPVPEQMAVHDLMAEGHLASMLRRIRRTAGERLEALQSLARRHWSGALTLDPAQAGMHVVARIDPRLGLTAPELCARARAAGVELQCLSEIAALPVARDGLVLGFAGFTEKRMEKAAERLAMVMREPARLAGAAAQVGRPVAAMPNR